MKKKFHEFFLLLFIWGNKRECVYMCIEMFPKSLQKPFTRTLLSSKEIARIINLINQTNNKWPEAV